METVMNNTGGVNVRALALYGFVFLSLTHWLSYTEAGLWTLASMVVLDTIVDALR
jgi:hypothetical protein